MLNTKGNSTPMPSGCKQSKLRSDYFNKALLYRSIMDALQHASINCPIISFSHQSNYLSSHVSLTVSRLYSNLCIRFILFPFKLSVILNISIMHLFGTKPGLLVVQEANFSCLMKHRSRVPQH